MSWKKDRANNEPTEIYWGSAKGTPIDLPPPGGIPARPVKVAQRKLFHSGAVNQGLHFSKASAGIIKDLATGVGAAGGFELAKLPVEFGLGSSLGSTIAKGLDNVKSTGANIIQTKVEQGFKTVTR